MRVLVTVKAYPGVSERQGETVCVAGVRLDTPQPHWIRLWPVNFRELPRDKQFKKWQIIELEAGKSTRDRRQESYTPNLDTLRCHEVVDTRNEWSKRRNHLGPLIADTTLCELLAAQDTAGQTPPPSLGMVKVGPGATVTVTPAAQWTEERLQRARRAAEPHLLRSDALTPMAGPLFDVRYNWRCMSPSCGGHQHVSCDWEVGATSLRFSKSYDDPVPHLANNFGARMLPPDHDTHFFMGNQHQRPKTFMVLGAFYPKV